MVWGLVIAAAASAIGGMVSANAAQRNADRATILANYNAIETRRFGQRQANMTALTALYNAKLFKTQAENKTAANLQVAKYNVNMLHQAANMNSMLYEAEINSVYESAELDTNVLHVAAEKARGTIEAQQSASGVIMNQDSAADTIIQQKKDEALEKLVIKLNAGTKAKQLMNASAMGQWEAAVTGQKLIYEAKMSGLTDMFNASLQSGAAIFNGQNAALSTMQSADNRALEGLFTAAQQAGNYESQATVARTQGAIGAADKFGSLIDTKSAA